MKIIHMDIQSTKNKRKGGKINEEQIDEKELMYSSGDSHVVGIVSHQCKCGLLLSTIKLGGISVL
jgi:hypothetical protein